MSMKRKALSLLSLLTLPMVLAACGNSEGSSNGDGAEGKTEIKITWRNTGENDKMTQYLEETFIPQFEKENEDIKIVLSPITASEGDYFSKVALSMQSESTAPDVVAEDSFMLNSDANAGYLTNLDEYVADWDQWDKYTENLKAGEIGRAHV